MKDGWHYNPNNFRFELYANGSLHSFVTESLVLSKRFPEEHYKFFQKIYLERKK
jgi:hypothetical protein